MRSSIFFVILPLVSALPGAQSTDERASEKRWVLQQGKVRLSPKEVKQHLAQGWQKFQIAQIDPEWTPEKIQQLTPEGRTQQQPGQTFKDEKQRNHDEEHKNGILDTSFPPVPPNSDKIRPSDCQDDESIKGLEGKTAPMDRLNPGDSQNDGKGMEAGKEKTAPTDFIKEVLALHNAARAEYGLNETEMQTWSNDAAAVAQDWAEGCLREHPNEGKGMHFTQSIGSASKINQLVFGGSDPELDFDMKAMRFVFQAFKAEEKDYDFTIKHTEELMERGEEYFLKVGHFLTVVSRQLGQVGCASHYCPVLRDNDGNALKDEVFVVCNYVRTIWMADTDPDTVPRKVQS